MATTKLMTIEDVLELGAESDDRFELIEGELIRMSPDGGEHGWVGFEAGALIRDFARPRDLGEVFNSDTGYLFSISPTTLLSPDASFIHADRLPPRAT